VQNAALSQSKEVLEPRRIEVEQTKADRWNGQLPQKVYAGTPIPLFQARHGDSAPAR
jgi:prohibitin 2